MSILRLFDRALRAKERVAPTPADVVYRENKLRLLRYRRAATRRFQTPILMVPSLINRHYVLDLMKGKSFVAYLLDRGHDVYIIDWGTPTSEDRYITFDDVCDTYLGRAVRRCARDAGADGVHLLGYCMGGTLTSIYTAVRPEKVSTMVALAAPISFDDDSLLSRWTRTPGFDVSTMVEACGLVPWQLLQASFHMIKPTLNLNKAVAVLDRMRDGEFLDGFFALETWGNDNVSIPGAFYERYINELYRKNALIEGTFSLSGRPVDLGAITCPVLAVTFSGDYIVPEESAAPLLTHISSKDKTQLRNKGGHVGAVVSRKARHGLWPALASWWEERAHPPVEVDAAPISDSTSACADAGPVRRSSGEHPVSTPPR